MSLTMQRLSGTRRNGSTAPHTNGTINPSPLQRDINELNARIEVDAEFLQVLLTEVNKVMVGQEQLVERVLIGLLADGHILLEGVPGLAKTLLIKTMARYPEVVENSAALMEPHRITFYLMRLAAAFHAYYNKHRVLVDDPGTASARLYLVLAVRQVIRNGLTLLGVSAPDRM